MFSMRLSDSWEPMLFKRFTAWVGIIFNLHVGYRIVPAASAPAFHDIAPFQG